MAGSKVRSDSGYNKTDTGLAKSESASGMGLTNERVANEAGCDTGR